MFFLNKKSNKGFTILEIIIVVFFMGLISTVVVVSYNKGGNDISLLISTRRLTQDIRRVQTMAGKEEISCKTGGSYDDDYSYSYGIYIDETKNNSYIIFADCNGDNIYTGDDEIIEEITIEDAVKIGDFSPKTSGNLYIVFTPPSKVFINENEEIAEITLYLKNNPSETQTVSVNEVGMIHFF